MKLLKLIEPDSVVLWMETVGKLGAHLIYPCQVAYFVDLQVDWCKELVL